jgi:NADPH-dependent F420 reductase
VNPVGVIGGTGPAGSALAARLADRGVPVVLGSRSLARAEERVGLLRDRWGSRLAQLSAGTNEAAAEAGPVVFLACNWEAALPAASALACPLAGRTVACMANGLRRNGAAFECIVPPEGSIAAQVQLALPDSQVVAALHHLPAGKLAELDHKLVADVLVAGDDGPVGEVGALIEMVHDLRVVAAGPLANAAALEAMTAVLVTINVRTRSHQTVQLLPA